MNEELRAEELEALAAIYDGDPALTVESNVVRYKVGEDKSKQSFVLALHLVDTYPTDSPPELDLSSFYNNSLSSGQVTRIENIVKEEFEAGEGAAICYTVIERLRDSLDAIFVEEEEDEKSTDPLDVNEAIKETNETVNNEGKLNETCISNNNLTKAQKRRLWDRGGLNTQDRPRGWDWVDVIRHLSQTGAKENC